MTGSLIDRRELAIRMAAPYLAVLVFWCFFHSAWLTLLAYHAQILWWSRASFPRLAIPRRTSMLLLVLPSAFAGPLMYFLLPLATRVDLSSWLADHHLTGLALALMVPYYGLVHPILEQGYWTPLRESTPLAHLAFASYHMLVLGSLLTIPWLIVSLVVLVTASFMWQRMASESLLLAITTHAVADLGIVVAAWLRS